MIRDAFFGEEGWKNVPGIIQRKTFPGLPRGYLDKNPGFSFILLSQGKSSIVFSLVVCSVSVRLSGIPVCRFVSTVFDNQNKRHTVNIHICKFLVVPKWLVQQL